MAGAGHPRSCFGQSQGPWRPGVAAELGMFPEMGDTPKWDGLIHRIPDAHAHKNDILAKYMVILPVNVGDYFVGII